MPRRFTLTSLEARCRKRVDQPSSGGPLSSEWTHLISEAYGGEVYSVVCDAGSSYFEHTAFLVTTGVEYVSEPAAIFSTVGIDYIDAAGHRTPLTPLMPQERARASGRTGSRATEFFLVDDRIYLYPTPPASTTSYEIRYIPQPPDLSTFSGTDVVDLVTPDGEALLIWSVAVKAHGILETDATLAMAERERARERFMNWVVMREFNAPRHIVTIDGYDAASDPADWINR